MIRLCWSETRVYLWGSRVPEAVLLMEEEVPHAASLGEADGYGFHGSGFRRAVVAFQRTEDALDYRKLHGGLLLLTSEADRIWISW